MQLPIILEKFSLRLNVCNENVAVDVACLNSSLQSHFMPFSLKRSRFVFYKVVSQKLTTSKITYEWKRKTEKVEGISYNQVVYAGHCSRKHLSSYLRCLKLGAVWSSWIPRLQGLPGSRGNWHETQSDSITSTVFGFSLLQAERTGLCTGSMFIIQCWRLKKLYVFQISLLEPKLSYWLFKQPG